MKIFSYQSIIDLLILAKEPTRKFQIRDCQRFFGWYVFQTTSRFALIALLLDPLFDEKFSLFCKIELSTMYRTMEAKNYLTPEAAIEDLKEG